jgi:cytochrome c-type biogenesis protein CcmE
MKRVFTVSIVVLIAGVGALIVFSSLSAGIYQLDIEQALRMSQSLKGKDFRVTGIVREVTEKKPFNYSFKIVDANGNFLNCFYEGSLPDPFQEGREVILQGRFAEDLTLAVSKITVKCPSKYEEAGKSELDYKDYYEQKYRRGHNQLNNR